jgi:cytochrome c peroxidase
MGIRTFAPMRIWYFLLLFPCLLLVLAAFGPGNPDSVENLGERLFFDPLLSEDSTVSCASCHIPKFAFADTALLSKGVGGRLGRRNSPSLTNLGARPHFFFDGRAASLEAQAMMPILDTLEMRGSVALLEARLQRNPRYAAAFQSLFSESPSLTRATEAIAAYIRTLETSNTPFDRWMQGDAAAMSPEAVRGRALFMKKGRCFDCHFSPDFTGDEFRNIGTYTDSGLWTDVGRYGITRDSADLGKFKVPGLRNVAVTAPYMHNGRFRSLAEVIDFYDKPDRMILGSINRDTIFDKPLHLTLEEKADLEAFLHALTDDRFK